MLASDNWLKWDPVAWEALVPTVCWMSDESVDDHLSVRGAHLLGSLTDLHQEGKLDEVRQAGSHDVSPRLCAMKKSQSRKGTS